MMQTNDAIVARMMTSRTRGTKIPPLSDDEPLSLDRGYQIQDAYHDFIGTRQDVGGLETSGQGLWAGRLWLSKNRYMGFYFRLL